MATKVRHKLSTPEAVAMGVEAAREWERERQREEAQAKKEEALEQEREDYMRPLMERGLSKSEAERAWVTHVEKTTVFEAAQLRAEARRRIGRKF